MLQPGDVVTIELPGGGGYGNPENRKPDLVEKDIKAGLVTATKSQKNRKGADMLSLAEKETRHGLFRQILEIENLEALLLIGDPNVSLDFSGDYRYFTNNRTIVYREAVVISAARNQSCLQLPAVNCLKLRSDLLCAIADLPTT